MQKPKTDIWSQWLLERRFGGDSQQMQTILNDLYRVRHKVLDHANLAEGDTLADIGCGDGLIAFGALEKIKAGQVIFSDISQDLLNHAQLLAQDMQVLHRCQFLQASADDLSALADESVDVVTTRSVLIYVSDKSQALQEFYRVLKPKGRLSIFEPINRFAHPEPPNLFMGYDITPVKTIVDKLKAVYAAIQPLETDPMLDFDERDLITRAEKAGFSEVHLDLKVTVQPKIERAENVGQSWETVLHTAWNPKIPTLAEAMTQALTADERERLTTHLRPLVKTKQGVNRSAVAYLWAVK